MKDWVCRKCGHEVLSDKRPPKIHWDDGHTCYFFEVGSEEQLTSDLQKIADDLGAVLIKED
jgi:hypothetical protein